MRICTASKPQGGVLIVCILTTAIIGIALASYLDLMASQNQSTLRSLAWNSALPVLEGGVEEALAHLYVNDRTNLASNGWTLLNGDYVRWRAVGDGKVHVAISNAISKPVIFAEGYAQVPLSGGRWITRLVRVETKKDGLFTKAMVAKGKITFNGNNILVDSFDSSNPAYSSNGIYVASKRKDKGDIATNSGLVNSLSTGNAEVYGSVATGPGGTVDIGSSGAAGSKTWIDGGNTGIQSGWYKDDMNISIPDVSLPFAGGSFTPVGDSVYQYILSASANYEVTTVTGSVLVKSNANAVLLVDGNISLTGNDKIEIEPGGSLQLYVAGPSVRIAGDGVVNHNGNATNFYYWGLPGNTELTVSGNGTFTGVIYAPSANFTLNGGGSSAEDITGSSVTATTTINGKFQFHYDEDLANGPHHRGYIITSWNEL